MMHRKLRTNARDQERKRDDMMLWLLLMWNTVCRVGRCSPRSLRGYRDIQIMCSY